MDLPSIFLNKMLSETVKRNATSLHLIVGNAPSVRVGGRSIALEGENIITTELLEKLMAMIMDGEEIKKFELEKEITMVKNFTDELRFRINIHFQNNFPSLSFYHIAKNFKNFEDLNLPPSINMVLGLKYGLFIVAGPFSSGKTTTIASLLEEINKFKPAHIITIEDPIEYLFIGKKASIEQMQVGRDIKTIISGLDLCMNEDVDIVFVGEIKKDFNAALPLILDLAAGNCLVVLEMNAISTTMAVEKILDAMKESISDEAARYHLADVLAGVLVQQLIPKVGGGNALAVELLLANPSIKSLIREGKIYQLESIIQTSRSEGMISMDKSIEELYQAGEVKREDLNNIY
jgi:twitching motility protein PilT